MANPQKRKGDRAELEAAELLTRLLGVPVRRQLGAGRADDTGDLDGVPDHAIQVCSWADLSRALRQKPRDAELQAAARGCRYSTAMIKLPRAGWRMCQTPMAWADLTLAALMRQP